MTWREWSSRSIESTFGVPKHHLPFEIVHKSGMKFSLLAVWTKLLPGVSAPYVEALLAAFAAHASLFIGGPTVVAGDFNSTPNLTKRKWGEGHLRVVDALQAVGLRSAYHSFHGVTHGHEEHPTFYLRKERERPSHIDYCFLPEAWMARIVSVTVGDFETWNHASDHRPLVVDLRLD